MRNRLRRNFPWLLLNSSAALVMVLLLRETLVTWRAIPVFASVYELAGQWAIRLLLICLAMTPLRNLTGWNGALKLRKPAGLWAFGFALLHLLGILDLRTPENWWTLITTWYWIAGIVAFLVLSALAVTSNRWAMRKLGKNWKRLHRLVYLAGGLIVTHALVSAAFSKRGMASGRPTIQPEYLLYLVLLVILLALRVPLVRQQATRIRRVARLIRAAA